MNCALWEPYVDVVSESPLGGGLDSWCFVEHTHLFTMRSTEVPADAHETLALFWLAVFTSAFWVTVVFIMGVLQV